jgi:hypothetical protein
MSRAIPLFPLWAFMASFKGEVYLLLLFTNRHGVTSNKNLMFGNTAVRNSKINFLICQYTFGGIPFTQQNTHIVNIFHATTGFEPTSPQKMNVSGSMVIASCRFTTCTRPK